MRMKIHLFIILSVLYAPLSHADTPFSKYGAIQNVQNYSANRFWTPDGPYNQRFPTAVYATGPDVETDDCQNLVSYLVSMECGMRNKCISTQLSDIHPSIMLQLSQIPDGNYASACGGYIDTAFDTYKKQNSIAAPSAGAAFPTATGMGTTNDGSAFKMPNPLSPKLQEWQQGILDRKQELKDLQSANGVSDPHLVRTNQFPTTYTDLSFTERMENATAGYEPYKDARAFKEITVESEKDYLIRREKIEKRQNAYCQQNRNAYLAMKADLKTLQDCRTRGVKFADCKIKGTY